MKVAYTQKAPILLVAMLLLLWGTAVAQPTAGFTLSGTSGCAPFSLQGIDQSTGAVSYFWNFGDGFTASDDTVQHTYTAAGNYTITYIVTDLVGQKDTTTQIVEVTDGPQFVATTGAASCPANNDGSISVNVTSGAAPYLYSIDGSTPQAGNTFSNLSPGVYDIEVTDDNGCSSTDQILIGNSSINVTNVFTNGTCFNANDGTITATASGGTGPYEYSLNGGAFQTSNVFNNLQAGTYEVVARDATGCTGADLVMVSQPDDVIFTVDTKNETCGRGDGYIKIVSISGGSGGYTYLWSDGSTTDSLVNLSAGSYNFTVFDGAGCFKASPIYVITSTPSITAFVATDDAQCNGSADGEASVIASGGSGVFSYQWSSGASGVFANGFAAGVYDVTITDAVGCDTVINFTIGEPSPLTIDVCAVPASCLGCSDGSATAYATGGNGNYTYEWSNGAVGAQINNLIVASYSVTVTDQNGCTGGGIAIVDTSGTSCPVILSATITNASCPTCFDGSVDITACGARDLSVEWELVPSITTFPIAFTEDLVGFPPATYRVVVRDTTSITCFPAIDTFVIGNGNSCNLDVAIAMSPNTYCFGDTVDVFLDPQLTGGNGPFTYTWSNSVASDTQTISSVFTGVYSLTVTDGAGCSAADTVNIFPDFDCVWPGDANTDGVANNLDILAIGLGYGSTGPARSNPSVNWIGQGAPDWVDTIPGPINAKHPDCDGSGNVNIADTIAVDLNYGLTHMKRDGSGRSTDPALYFSYPSGFIQAGQTIQVAVHLGRDTLPVTDGYGIAFSVNFDTSIVAAVDGNNRPPRFIAQTSWLGVPGSNLMSYDKDLYSTGRVDIAVTRTDKLNGNGFGVLGYVSLTMKDDISGKRLDSIAILTLSFSNVEALANTGARIPIATEELELEIWKQPSGLPEDIQMLADRVQIYPNPAENTLFLDNRGVAIDNVRLFDLLGQQVFQQAAITDKKIFDISRIAAGSYYLQFEVDGYRVARKVLITR